MTSSAPAARARWLLSLAALGLLAAGCPRQPAEPAAYPLAFQVVYTAGAEPSQRLPMIVALHGLGDTPARFAALFAGFPEPARVVSAPPAPAKSGFPTLLVVVIVLLLVGGGGYAGYYFYMQSQQGAGADAPVGDTPQPQPPNPVPDPPKPADVQPTADAGVEAASAADAGPAEATGVDAVAPKPAKPEEKPGPDEPGKVAVVKPVKPVPDKPAPDRPAPDKPGPIKVTAKAQEIALGHYKTGNNLIRQQKFAAAIKEFQKALKVDPTLALAHRGLGIAYAQMRQNKQACGAYKSYMKMLPKDSKEIPTLQKILEGCK